MTAETKGLLVLVNPQNGVYLEGALADPEVGAQHVPRLAGLVKLAMRSGWSVALSLRLHEPTDDLVQSLTPHLLRGTTEPRLLDELRPLLKPLEAENRLHIFEASAFDHAAYSKERGTELSLREYALGFDQVHVAGAWSSVDVLYTVAGLRFHLGGQRQVVVWTQAAMGYDEESHDFAVRQMAVVLGASLCDEKVPL
jgi:nicotinamidase-related amidase